MSVFQFRLGTIGSSRHFSGAHGGNMDLSGNMEDVVRFFLEVMDGSADGPVRMSIDFESEEEAVREAHVALAEMARDGLPKEPVNVMSVELFDEHKRPITELRLTFEVIPKSIRQ